MHLLPTCIPNEQKLQIIESHKLCCGGRRKDTDFKYSNFRCNTESEKKNQSEKKKNTSKQVKTQ